MLIILSVIHTHKIVNLLTIVEYFEIKNWFSKSLWLSQVFKKITTKNEKNKAHRVQLFLAFPHFAQHKALNFFSFSIPHTT